MNRLSSIVELERWRDAAVQARTARPRRINVCGGRSCDTARSAALGAAFELELKKQNLDGQAEVVMTGCPGFCEPGPLVLVLPERILYTRVATGDAAEIVSETVGQKKVVERLLYRDPRSGLRITRDVDIPFYREQQRVLLRDSGLIDPTRIDDYVAAGGYKGLAKVLGGMRPEAVIDEIRQSELRGRGGGGFPVATKWELSRRADGDVKYVICNADEANPGAFQDRSLIGANPHTIIEGMMIGAYAVGASEGYIYIRHDHVATIEIVGHAIEQCRERGLLGSGILGSGFHFDLRVQLNAGAFVCGEETALIASIEGRVSEPRPRPPFPAQAGLWGKPTVINNAKTWATVPHILANGAAWYAQWGTASSKGTTVFSLNGKITNSGLVEVPMGVTLRQIIEHIGGGVRDGKRFKAAQPGGPSGGCIPESLIDLPIDYESLASVGSMMGSGGLIVMDEDTCMVDLARYFTAFNKGESCGQCVACREGTRHMSSILENITTGNGEEGDIELLTELGTAMVDGSLCGLGRAAPNPVLSTIRHFREEYEAHIKEKRCPAGTCKMPVPAESA